MADRSKTEEKTGKKDKLKVQVWIYFTDPVNRTVLFLTLLTKPERGSFWQPVTGSVHEEESLDSAALREAKEETGIQFLTAPIPIGKSFQYESHGQVINEFGFSLALKDLPEHVSLDPHEHVGYRWVNLQEAIRNVKHPSNVEMLKALVLKLGTGPAKTWP